MIKRLKPVLLKVIVGMGVSLLVLGVHAATLKGRVVGIVDGNTINIVDSRQQQHRIWVAGINAPKGSQPYAAEAKQALSELVLSKNVAVDWKRRDAARRIVGKVWYYPLGEDPACDPPPCTHTEFDTGMRLVENGHAWHDKQYSAEQSRQDRMLYADAEANARNAQVGLWSDDRAVAPWEWREKLVKPKILPRRK